MRSCDVAVVGLGLMGAAALDALLRRGADALGFDPLPVGAGTGSSHGSCRIFRRYNFENPNYTALSGEALDGWRRLAEASGRQLLLPCPILEAGPKGSEAVASSRAFAVRNGVDSPLLTGRAVNDLFPAFDLPDDWEAVLQQESAILLAEAALEAMRAGAAAAGRLVPRGVLALEEDGDGVVLTTAAERIRARRVVVAAGPWTRSLLPELAPLLTVTRQTVGWFRPARPQTVRFGQFPLFILHPGQGEIFYGFPDFEDRGVKAAPHSLGPEVGPDDWGPPVAEAELGALGQALERFIPGAAGPVSERDVCLYTSPAPGDRRPDGGEFIVDRLPGRPVIVGSACLGRGAKFAPAIGERLARLALEPDYRAEPAFRLSRYRRFPDD